MQVRVPPTKMKSCNRSPVSSTAWIFSLGPSERYESAQQPSASTSSSVEEESSCASTGSAGDTMLHAGWGLPRHRLESVQVALRSIDSLESVPKSWRSGERAPCVSTRSRHSGESPAMLPSAHIACAGDGEPQRREEEEAQRGEGGAEEATQRRRRREKGGVEQAAWGR